MGEYPINKQGKEGEVKGVWLLLRHVREENSHNHNEMCMERPLASSGITTANNYFLNSDLNV